MTLVLAILIMAVLTIALTTILVMTAAGARDAQRSNAGQRAYSLAESGLNNALAVLNSNYPGTFGYPGDPNLLATTLSAAVTLPSATISVAATTDFNPGVNTISISSSGALSGVITCTGITAVSFTGCTGGTGTFATGATVGRGTTYSPGFTHWSGALQNSPPGLSWFDQWNVTSTGSVPNPTGPTGAPVTRTIRAVVPVIIPLGDLEDTQAITAEEALALDQVKLESLMIRYGAKAVLVVIAEPAPEGGLAGKPWFWVAVGAVVVGAGVGAFLLLSHDNTNVPSSALGNYQF